MVDPLLPKCSNFQITEFFSSSWNGFWEHFRFRGHNQGSRGLDHFASEPFTVDCMLISFYTSFIHYLGVSDADITFYEAILLLCCFENSQGELSILLHPLGVISRPVLVAHLLQWNDSTWTASMEQPLKLISPNLSIFHQVWQHHNHTTLSLIDHLPEVSTGGLHWSLGNDEPPPLLVALYRCAQWVMWITCRQSTVKLSFSLNRAEPTRHDLLYVC